MHALVQEPAPQGATTVVLRGFSPLLTDLLAHALGRLGVIVLDGEAGSTGAVPDVTVLAAPAAHSAPSARVLVVDDGTPTVAELAAAITNGCFDRARRLDVSPSRSERPAACWQRLTPRELDVAKRVATGCTDEEVAAQMDISVYTVRAHLQHVRDKLHAGSRFAVVAALRESGLLRSVAVQPEPASDATPPS